MVSQLSLYIPESHCQRFRASPFLHNVQPSPWESLTYNLTLGLLSLGLDYPSLRESVYSSIKGYLDNCAEAINAVPTFKGYDHGADRYNAVNESASVLSLTVSLVGFLEASTLLTSFWSASEKLQIVECMRSMLSDHFMIAIETASSTIRNTGMADPSLGEWRRYNRFYATRGRPLGAMLLQEAFMRFIKSCATSLIGAENMSDDELLDDYMNGVGIARSHDHAEISLINRITEIVADQIQLLEDGSDYLQLGSPWQQRLTFSVKALALTGFLHCVILSEDASNRDHFLSWLEDTLVDPGQMSCNELATATLKSVAIIAKMSLNSASSGSRSLLRFIVDGGVSTRSTSLVAAKCLAQVLGILSEDAIVTTLYSLGNVLSPGFGTENSRQSYVVGDTAGHGNPLAPLAQGRNGSVGNLSIHGERDNTTYKNVVHAIVTIASGCNDEKISALAQSMLLQKIGKIDITVDSYIVRETAGLCSSTGPSEFQLLLKFYDRIYRDSSAKGHSSIVSAVQDAMAYLSVTLPRESPLHKIYLVHLLGGIVNKGDATDFEGEKHKDIILTPDDISPLLKPLALLVSPRMGSQEQHETNPEYDQDVSTLFRDAWFNIAVHGIFLSSNVARRHVKELRLLAKYSPPLVAEDRMEMLESDVELNTILRRGMGPQHLQEQRRNLATEIPTRESEIKRLSYPRAVFLNAALLVEVFRASSGNCTKILKYFRDPALSTVEMASCMNAIAEKVVGRYISLTLTGKREDFSVPYLSKELAGFFMACCHRIERVQIAATLCANMIIKECPSSLCEKHSLFALLELLTVMWFSCVEEELDEFEWKPTFTSRLGLVKVDLSDNFQFRKKTLHTFLEQARVWVTTIMDVAPLDVKGLLQVPGLSRHLHCCAYLTEN